MFQSVWPDPFSAESRLTPSRVVVHGDPLVLCCFVITERSNVAVPALHQQRNLHGKENDFCCTFARGS